MQMDPMEQTRRTITEAVEQNEPIGAVLKKAVYDPVDRLMENAGHLVSCQTGCAHCCKRTVVCSRAEALTIAEGIQRMEEPARQKLVRKILDHADTYLDFLGLYIDDEDPDEIWFLEDQTCPFLDEKNLCTIYEVRPLLCRTRHSLSPVEKCNEPENEIEVIQEVQDAMEFFYQSSLFIGEFFTGSDDMEEQGYLTILLADLFDHRSPPSIMPEDFYS